jgi:hypothetical protein
VVVAPFQGWIPPATFDPQGVALGWFVPAFQAEEGKVRDARLTCCAAASQVLSRCAANGHENSANIME